MPTSPKKGVNGRPLANGALVVLLGALWGSSYLLISLGLESFTPVSLIALRMAVASLALALLSWGRVRLRRFFSARLVLISLVNICIPFVLITYGQSSLPSSTVSVLSSTTPLFVIAFAILLGVERVGAAQVAGGAVAFVGVVLILTDDHGAPALLPSALVLIASAIYACGNLAVARFFADWNARELALSQSAWSVVILAPLLFFQEWHTPSPSAILSVVWLGVVGSAVTYLLYFHLIRTVGSSRTASNTFVQPVVGVILGAIVLRESVTGGLLLGAGLVIAGMVLVWRRGSRRTDS